MTLVAEEMMMTKNEKRSDEKHEAGDERSPSAGSETAAKPIARRNVKKRRTRRTERRNANGLMRSVAPKSKRPRAKGRSRATSTVAHVPTVEAPHPAPAVKIRRRR